MQLFSAWLRILKPLLKESLKGGDAASSSEREKVKIQKGKQTKYGYVQTFEPD